MKKSRHLAPALVLSAVVGGALLAALSPVGAMVADGAQLAADTGARCESREVEADEGYGVSHRVTREICR